MEEVLTPASATHTTALAVELAFACIVVEDAAESAAEFAKGHLAVGAATRYRLHSEAQLASELFHTEPI